VLGVGCGVVIAVFLSARHLRESFAFHLVFGRAALLTLISHK